MRTKLANILPAAVLLLCAAMTWAASPVPDKDPDHALADLMAGNVRFARGTSLHSDQDAARRLATLHGDQEPGAIILSCADSRVPPEIIFDQGIGHIFSVRLAGNVATSGGMGTAEYGVAKLGVRLLVVLGHTDCGAVQAVLSGADATGELRRLLAPIAPAVRRATQNNPGLGQDALTVKAVEENVWQAIADMVRGSPVLRQYAASGRLKIVGAVYHLDSGAVAWLGEHPDKTRLFSN